MRRGCDDYHDAGAELLVEGWALIRRLEGESSFRQTAAAIEDMSEDDVRVALLASIYRPRRAHGTASEIRSRPDG